MFKLDERISRIVLNHRSALNHVDYSTLSRECEIENKIQKTNIYHVEYSYYPDKSAYFYETGKAFGVARH